MNFSGKSCKKLLISWKSTRNHRSGPKFATFRRNYHVFGFRWTFQKKVAKSASFREKARKPSIWPKLSTFRANYHVFAFSWTFQQEVAKSASFREKTRKTIDLAKTMQLFEETTMSWPFHELSERNCKNCLISRESTRNNQFGQNLQLFEKTTMFLRFDEHYRKKLQKLPHLVEKHENSSIWPKLCNFFEQTTMFWCLDELFSKRLQKVAEFVKKHEKSSICIPIKLSLHFDELFRKKLQKVPHFLQKHEKSSILPNLCNFSNKLPCLCISMNFLGKSWKKCLISWKSTRIHRFGQNYQLFEQNFHVLAFSWTF